jgi:hypothetical protein
VGPAADWLLDNYHVVQEHVREVREALPRGYYRELPELTTGPLAGYPRIYEVAITLISHTEGRADAENVDSSSAPTRRPRRSRWASCGPSPPCCGWGSSRTSAA